MYFLRFRTGYGRPHRFLETCEVSLCRLLKLIFHAPHPSPLSTFPFICACITANPSSSTRRTVTLITDY